MLLVLDVGNTNTVLGVFSRTPVRESASAAGTRAEAAEYQHLVAHWRVGTVRTQTVDEYGVLFRNLFAMAGVDFGAVRGIVISSVVPPMDGTLREVCERYFGVLPLFIEPGVKTGMPVLYENPAEVGADRIVNGVAAFEKYGGPCIVVDFGTATTFDAVSRKGEYLGGVIAPGLGISADALFTRTARLQRVDIRKPARVIGTTTVGSLQSQQGDRDRRAGVADRRRFEIHHRGRRPAHAGRPAYHLGAAGGGHCTRRTRCGASG
jgi:type III pantothenate kinase